MLDPRFAKRLQGSDLVTKAVDSEKNSELPRASCVIELSDYLLDSMLECHTKIRVHGL